MENNNEISSDFPFTSKYIEIKETQIHYIDQGKGDPILFLHGNPTSSYLWRNIIPCMTGQGRCIALDLPGFGKSGKPDIGYRISDHFEYINEFITKLDLKNITLVIHDWGSYLGFNYARLNPSNVKGIAFMESIIKTSTWEDFSPKFRKRFKMLRTPFIGWIMIGWFNMFINKILPGAIVRPLSAEEKAVYAAPFKTLSDRLPLWVFPNEIPIEGKPADVVEVVSSYNKWMQETDTPMLLFHATPGVIITKCLVQWCKDNITNINTVDIGQGIHYLQEDNPKLIGQELSKWYKTL